MDITETTKKKPMTKDQIIQELMELLKENNRKQDANEVFEICTYVDGLEKKLDSVTEELTKVREQIKEMQEDTLLNNLKKSVSEAADRLENRCNIIKEQLFVVKTNLKDKASEIVQETKRKGKAALNKVSEFFGIRDKLVAVRTNVKEAQRETDITIAKIDAFGKGMREANQQIANTIRTFADKETVDYSTQEKKFSKTDAVKKPWEAKKRLLASMELRLDAAIEKVENLSRDVKIDKMKQTFDELMEKSQQEQTSMPIAMVAEQECQYGSDEFEKVQQGTEAALLEKAPKPVMQGKAR